jgi:hypothetical protein
MNCKFSLFVPHLMIVIILDVDSFQGYRIDFSLDSNDFV